VAFVALVGLTGTTAFEVVFGRDVFVSLDAAVKAGFAVLATMAVAATLASVGATQSLTTEGTASRPLPMDTRLVPQFAP
jgi:hypothetical protein